MRRTVVSAVAATLVASGGIVYLASPAQAAEVTNAPSCSSSGAWQPGELNIFVLNVGQADSQLIVGPTGRTMLIDLGERSWNAFHDPVASHVADLVRDICGIGSGPVHLDYVMISHHHLDHAGYAGNPNDTNNVGNGLWQLLHPDHQAFTVGTLIDRDAGDWVDTNGNGTCEVGTSTEPADEFVWHHAGTLSQTTRRLICWLYGPDGQHDRLHIEGRVERITNGGPWPSYDLGPGVGADVVLVNADGVMQVDGVTPVSGNHTGSLLPPSENDYSIVFTLRYGDYSYATAGDLDGVYTVSSFGYSYNDIEAAVAEDIGDVDTLRVNHHGSGHSTSAFFTEVLAPETALISCGSNNSFGHPANRTLDELRGVSNGLGVGADIYITNNPCASNDRSGDPIDYTGVLTAEQGIYLHTTAGGSGYTVHYDTGSHSYPAGLPPAGGGSPSGTVLISELRLRGPGGANDEFVELRNTGSGDANISGWRLQACTGTTGAASNRATVPAGTVLPPGGHYLIARDTHYTGGPAPDLTFTAAIADEGGVRILNASSGYVDGVGSATPASSECREGTGLAFPAGNNDVSFHRDGGGSVDTDDNFADFVGPAPSQPTNALGATS